jgi:hypothetical protein
MTKDDRDRAEARFNKPQKQPRTQTGKTDRDAAAKAVLDNMAKLKALRLAREAAEPRASRRGQEAARQIAKQSGEKAPALATGWRASKAEGAGLGLKPARAIRSSTASWSRRRKPAPEASGIVLQRHARLFGGFDRVVMRLEVTVHDQRVAIGRRLVGANDFARLLFFRLDLRLLHASGSCVAIFAPLYTECRKKAGRLSASGLICRQWR